MNRSALLLSALIGLVALAMRDAQAGAAVALGPHNQLATAYGGPVAMAKQRALDIAHRKYGRMCEF
jgi:hypothetical protein